MLTLEEISARVEITEALQRYCRGIDRRDAEVLTSAYWDDAVDIRSYRRPDSTPEEFAQLVITGFGSLPHFSQHHITNVNFLELDLTVGVANVETYNIVFHPVPAATESTSLTETGTDAAALRVIGGRALDRFERRDDEWRIARRVMLIDWSRDDFAGRPVWADLLPQLTAGPAGRDPSYTLFGTAS